MNFRVWKKKKKEKKQEKRKKTRKNLSISSENQRGYLTDFSICNFNRVDDTKDTKDFFLCAVCILLVLSDNSHRSLLHPEMSSRAQIPKETLPWKLPVLVTPFSVFLTPSSQPKPSGDVEPVPTPGPADGAVVWTWRWLWGLSICRFPAERLCRCCLGLGVFAAAISIANYYYSRAWAEPRGWCGVLLLVPPAQAALHRSRSCSLLLTFSCCLQLQFSDKNQLITFLELAMKWGYIKLH